MIPMNVWRFVKTCRLVPVLAVLSFAGLGLGSGLAWGAGLSPEAEAVTVIEHVSVLPMDRPGVLDDQVVEVRGGVITHVGPRAGYTAPAGARHVDGGNGYLMPGLADMHTHIRNDSSAPAALGHYLSYGVTTIRTLSGEASLLDLRKRVADGSLLGPRLWVSGPIIIGMPDGTPYEMASRALVSGAGFLLVGAVLLWARRRRTGVQGWVSLLPLLAVSAGAGALLWFWPPLDLRYDLHNLMGGQSFTTDSAKAARREVDRQVAAGYDLIKVYDMLPGDAYLAAVKEARERGIYVTGHLPDAVPLATVLGSGLREVAHADEFTSYHWIGYDPHDDDWSAKLLTFKMDYASIPHTVALLKTNDQAVVSNLVTDETVYRMIRNPRGVLAGAEYDAIAADTREAWMGGRVARWKGQDDFREKTIQPFLRALVKAMADKDVLLLVGSDVTVEGMVPGYHLVRDVELLQQAGVPAYDALRAATVNAAIVSGRMGKDARWGAVKVGNRADLLLLRANPLETVANLYGATGVMANGRWLDETALKELRARAFDIHTVD